MLFLPNFNGNCNVRPWSVCPWSVARYRASDSSLDYRELSESISTEYEPRTNGQRCTYRLRLSR